MTAPLAGLRGGLGPGRLLRLQRGRSRASVKELLGLASLRKDGLAQSGRNYRAVLCTELTKPLIIRNLPAPSLQPHEVRVGVHYCGVNFADILACKGLYQEKHCLPFTPGMEFSGTVVEIGANVSTVREGDRVIGVTGMGAMAEECVTDQKMLWPIPEGVSDEEAAALPVSYGTAILALEHRARTQPGYRWYFYIYEERIVSWLTLYWDARDLEGNGSSDGSRGATGLAAVDVAANVLKAKVIAAAGSDHKCNLALQKGAAHSVNYTQGSLKEEAKKLTENRGVNVVLDAVGGDTFKAALHSLAWEGRIVVVGFAGGAIPSVPANLLLLKNVSALGVFWGRYREEDFPVFSSSLSSALWYCQERRIRPHVGAVFKLEEVNEAFSRVTQRKSTGKVIISTK